MRVMVWRRSKVSECFWKQLKLCMIIVPLVLLLVPLRNILLYFVLPGIWKEHGSLFLLKVLLDWHNFPVEETPIGQSPVKLNININDIQTKFTSRHQSFLAFHERKAFLSKMSTFDSDAKLELEQLLKFKPPMSEFDRAVAFFTLDVFVNACEAANLTYFLISGSALGAVRHHGMIPWDDDIDIVMNSSQWKEIRNVLGNIPAFELFAPGNTQWKFFMKSLPKSNKPFKWPNVDIFFFNEDDTHIWSQTWGAKGSLCNKKSDIFPLRRRKFERWNLPVPRLLESVISAEFGNFNSACKTATYDHKLNVELSWSSLTSVDCQKLHSVFPFVFREVTKQGSIVEICKVAGQQIGNITVPLEL